MKIPLHQIIELFVWLLILGTGLCLPLYRFKYHVFFRSALFVKILMWLPISSLFIGTLFLGATSRWLILVALVLVCSIEQWRVRRAIGHSPIWYFCLINVALLHFALLGRYFGAEFVSILITLCIASVLSDVVAFFFGRYLGRHFLPSSLNSGKSWEGVVGQLIGAFVGVILVKWFVIAGIPFWLGFPIGLGSAAGDLTNSFVKRSLRIKDWSSFLPGHGGFTDRLSSLSGAAIILFYTLLIFDF